MSEERKTEMVYTLSGGQTSIPFFNRQSDKRPTIAATFEHNEIFSLVFHKDDLVEMFCLLDNDEAPEVAKDLKRCMFLMMKDRMDAALEQKDKVDE